MSSGRQSNSPSSPPRRTLPGNQRAAPLLFGALGISAAQIATMIATSATTLPKPDMAQWYAANEARIAAASLRTEGPNVLSVNPSYGLRRVTLAYPPD
ncbi:MAG TPA: hypothetical protein VMU94_01010 [Streptosporangiaceae bacterium]|nr:hypothetical protein [Streptosporangiaceae bacterium]